MPGKFVDSFRRENIIHQDRNIRCEIFDASDLKNICEEYVLCDCANRHFSLISESG